MGDLPKRRYAVIIDEAHSSQGGETATELKGVLGGAGIKEEARRKAEEEGGLPDHEEEILKTMAKRGRQPNISFFAFTATPKYKPWRFSASPGPMGNRNLSTFTVCGRQPKKNFILDVLQYYTTYKTYYRLIKSIADDPKKALEGFFIDRMDQNEEITAKFMNEKDFQEIVTKHLLKQVYEQIRVEGT